MKIMKLFVGVVAICNVDDCRDLVLYCLLYHKCRKVTAQLESIALFPTLFDKQEVVFSFI